MLDLWQNDTAVTAAPQPTEGKDLPATFGEGFDAAWNEGRLFATSIAGENARMSALQDHIDNLSQTTGKDINQQIDFSSFNVPGVGFVPPGANELLPQVNAAAAKLGQPELSSDDLEQRAVEKSRAAQSAYADFAGREHGPGAGLGALIGGAAAQAADPINLIAMPIAPEAESVSVLAAALRFGAVAGVAQAGIEAVGAPYHEEVQPGYLASGAPLVNVASAFGQGAALGGGLKFLGNAWTRVKTGAWPQSVRDAGNLVESEANIASTNVYPGADGEAAHRAALSGTIDSILKGRPVDVSRDVPPELEALAGKTAEPPPIEPARAAAEEARAAAGAPTETQPQPELPFEATAAVAKMRQTNEVLAGGVQQIARRAGYDMPEEEAARVAERLVGATPEEADDMLRDLQVSPRQVAEAPTVTRSTVEAPPVAVEPSARLTGSPDFQNAIRGDIDRERVKGDVQIPVDVDKDGNAVMRGVDSAMNEVDAYKTAADEIQACASGPAAEPEAEAA